MSAHFTVDELKAQARRLRETMAARGNPLDHSAALEIVAKTHGLRDWNTAAALAARADNRKSFSLSVGATVTGRYLDQPFSGKVLSVSRLSDGEFHQVTLHFDEPVDVVTFPSFSAFRQRVTGTIGADGVSPRHTSNGMPQLVIDL